MGAPSSSFRIRHVFIPITLVGNKAPLGKSFNYSPVDFYPRILQSQANFQRKKNGGQEVRNFFQPNTEQKQRTNRGLRGKICRSFLDYI